ncbi:PREDICTED: ankyrin repeat-containing protein NPR4-like isoform X5 [Camelina sativa]|uniref:Ankyrin repeat-containing protein NPR4-like isoform X5 n=1 Tax=Camelina sativa TaxID=90675 RepID=A0ABM0XTX7_CAMSA|nr:PREDICTED: ankyrin repeat-containing protein NPR4-like isoform X5 [Camelina sativa]
MSSNQLGQAVEETVERRPFKFSKTKFFHGILEVSSEDSSSPIKEVPEKEAPSDQFNLQIPTASQLHVDVGRVTNEYYEYIQLNQGISQGRVEAVKDFLNRWPDAVDKFINPYETPLLKACAYGNPEIVKLLLRRMTPEQMLPKMSQSAFYNTPLTIVAVSGNMEIAEALVAKNPKLLEIPGNNGEIPVVVAVENTQMEMARYLYNRTPVEVLLDKDGFHGILLLLNAIYYKKLGIQVKQPPFPKPSRSNKGHQTDTLMGKLLKCLSKWTGIDELYRLKVTHLQAKKLLRGISEETLALGLKERSESVDEALLFAVRYGNVDFLVEMIKNNSELLWSTGTSTLFNTAVEVRQEKVYSLLYGLGDRKYLFLADKNSDGNSVLHLAGYPPPNYKLATVVSATLQMQSELQWFKEMERIVPAIEKERVNTEDLTPIEIFRKEHEAMRLEAEKWMKDTAMSCSFVAALIVTVTFAAIFTVPGGTDDNSRGKPFHLHKPKFVIFIVSDLISCFASCTSVLIFLGILTARYAFDDFLFSLPAKMIAGLSTLFVSIAAMLVAFSSSLFTIFNVPWIVAPTIFLACFPALLFVRIQYPLLKELIFSTYGKKIFDRKMKSLF